MIDELRLLQATSRALKPHLGVAAEFVAEDALAAFRSGRLSAQSTVEASLQVYFIGLGGLLEKTLPFERIRDQIVKTYDPAA